MDKPWLAHYPPGTPAEINLSGGDTLVSIFEESCRRYADRTAFVCMGKALTYRDLDRQSAAFGAWLQSKAGLERGARVALMMPNILQYPVALFGTLRAGYTVVNVNPLYTPRELEHQLKDSGAEAIVILANFAVTLDEVVAKTQVKKVIVTDFGDMLGFPKSAIVNFVLRRVKKMVPAYSLPGHERWNSVLSAGSSLKLSPPEISQDDLAFLQYTGGTTGLSKGAMLTHRNMTANLMQMRAWIDSIVDENDTEVVITALPLYHVFSLVCNCMLFMSLGSTNVLIANPRDIPAFVKELGRHRFLFRLVPPPGDDGGQQ